MKTKAPFTWREDDVSPRIIQARYIFFSLQYNGLYLALTLGSSYLSRLTRDDPSARMILSPCKRSATERPIYFNFNNQNNIQINDMRPSKHRLDSQLVIFWFW